MRLDTYGRINKVTKPKRFLILKVRGNRDGNKRRNI